MLETAKDAKIAKEAGCDFDFFSLRELSDLEPAAAGGRFEKHMEQSRAGGIKPI